MDFESHKAKVLAVLDSPAAFTQDAFARDAAGNPVDPTDNAAVSFCLNGAIVKASYQGGTKEEWEQFIEKLAFAPGTLDQATRFLADFANSHTYDEVVSALAAA